MKWTVVALILAACAPQLDPAALRASFDAEHVARLDVPVVFLTGADTATALVPVAKSGLVQTWQSRDDIRISETAGIVIATHGLGHDMIAADAAGVTAALKGRMTPYMRHWVHLDGQLQPVTRSVRCRLVPGQMMRHQAPLKIVPITTFVETCGGETPVTNHYHIADDGTIWWSRQWISDRVGTITLERVAR